MTIKFRKIVFKVKKTDQNVQKKTLCLITAYFQKVKILNAL